MRRGFAVSITPSVRYVERLSGWPKPRMMATLMFLTRCMTHTNAIAVSQVVIAEIVGISISSVVAAVKTREKHRFIEVAKVGNMAVYNIYARLAWQGNCGKRNAHFVADLIAVESEQSRNCSRISS